MSAIVGRGAPGASHLRVTIEVAPTTLGYECNGDAPVNMVAMRLVTDDATSEFVFTRSDALRLVAELLIATGVGR